MSVHVITITTTIQAPIHTVFESYLSPADNLRWNTAGEGWTVSHTTINPVIGGTYSIGFKSPDGANDFDFGGVYTNIIPDQLITSILDDGRHVKVLFEEKDNEAIVTIEFDAEQENSLELQEQGWGKILTHFKQFIERKSKPTHRSILKTIDIHASVEKVWDVLLQDQSYRQWTKVFDEDSYYEGEMKYQGKIKFLSSHNGGLASNVHVYIPYYQISFEHLGVIIDGVEDFDNPQFADWKGARETYTLTPQGSSTHLEIYVELTQEEYEYMSNLWDQALIKIKDLAEK